MPLFTGEPWRGATSVSAISSGAGRQFSAILVTSGGPEPAAHPTGNQNVWQGDPGDVFTLWVKWSASGTTSIQTPNKVELRCVLPGGDLTTTLIGTAITLNVGGDAGSASVTLHLDDNPLNGTLGSLRSGMFEIYLKVIKDDGLSAVNYSIDTRGVASGTPLAGFTVTNARGKIRSRLVVNNLSLSNSSLGGTAPSKFAYPDDVFLRYVFSAPTYRSIAMNAHLFQHHVGSGVWGTSYNNLYGFSVASDNVVSNKITFCHRTGSGWTGNIVNIGASNNIDIFGFSDSDIWALNSLNENGNPNVMHYDGISWTRIEEINKDLNRIWGATSNDLYYIGGDSGLVFRHWNGTSFSTPSIPNNVFAIYDIFGTATNDVWAVGATTNQPSTGIILHWNGTAWLSSFQSPDGTYLNFVGVWAASSVRAWAITDSGNIYNWDGISWTVDSFSITNDSRALNYIYGVSATDVWAGGAGGVLIHWNGTNWTIYTVSDTFFVPDKIFATASNEVYFIGNGKFYRWNGTEIVLDSDSNDRIISTTASTSVTRDFTFNSNSTKILDDLNISELLVYLDTGASIALTFGGDLENLVKETSTSMTSNSTVIFLTGIMADPTVVFNSITRTSTLPVVNYGIHNVTGTFELINARNEKLTSSHGSYATAVVKTKDVTNGYIQSTVSSALNPNSLGTYTITSFTFTGPTLLADRNWSTDTTKDTAAFSTSGLPKTLYVSLGGAAGVAQSLQSTISGLTTWVSLSSLFSIDVHPQKTSTLNKTTEINAFMIGYDTVYLYAYVTDVTGAGVGNVRIDLSYLDPESTVRLVDTSKTTSNFAPNVGWVTTGFEYQPNTLVGTWTARGKIDLNYSGALGNYGGAVTGITDQSILFVSPYTQDRDLTIHAPSLVGIGDSVNIMVEMVKQDGTRLNFDSAPSIRVFKLDSVTGSQTDDLSSVSMNQISTSPAYKQTWIPVSSGLFAVEIKGLINGIGVERVLRINSIPRYCYVNGALIPRID